MSYTKLLILIPVTLLMLLGCQREPGGSSGGPDLAGALDVMPVEDRRIGILHSSSSAENFYDKFEYNQLFAAMQNQAMQAGVPYDLLTESDLVDGNALSQYDALLMPAFSNVAADLRDSISAALLQAQQAGTAIVTSGEFMMLDENNQPFLAPENVMEQLLNLTPVNFLSSVAATVKIARADHPVTLQYDVGETLVSYDQTWFAEFAPVNGVQSVELASIETNGATYPGVQVLDTQGTVVHFANEQIMADHNLLWSVLQFAVYGSEAPVALRVSRSDSVFIARNDMDQAMIAAQLPLTEFPLLDIISDWKQNYDFVGSYYLDIGNDPTSGQYTDWAVSGPLYANYLALGSEIGTHSWTHPHYTSLLSDTELEFEFNQSRAELETQLGISVVGGAVPGNAESLNVVENLNQWFDYFSGRTGDIGSGFRTAIGFLEPQHDMMYFSLNMSPDYTLIDFLNYSPAQATDIWRSEMDLVSQHASLPIMHWLWHDYGPTSSAASGFYSQAMFDDTIAYAHAQGTEFTTLADLSSRLRQMSEVQISVGSNSVIEANVNAQGVGQFALETAQDVSIREVANWYAYDDDSVFLPDNGGQFQITTGDTPSPVTHVTNLPKRARLLTVTGTGHEIEFSFEGQGDVTVVLSHEMQGNFSIMGADSYAVNSGVLTLNFAANATHNVAITAITPINSPPTASNISVQTETETSVNVQLTASDIDGDALTYTVVAQPRHGVLSGVAPNLTYTPDTGFVGADSFIFVASDGTVQTAEKTVQITVTPPVPNNNQPVVFTAVYETLIDQALDFVVTGYDIEKQSLNFQVSTAPQHGTVNGTSPLFTYTPASGFSGTDEFSIVANDGELTSSPSNFVVHVRSHPSPPNGTVTNHLTSVISIDGQLDDWTGLTFFADDPDDISGSNNDINWKSSAMAHDDSQFYLVYENYGPVNLSWGHALYIDTDTDKSTGFVGFGEEYSIGADFLLEGRSLLKYTGSTGTSWSWTYLGEVQASVTGGTVEVALSRSALGSPQNLRFYWHGNSAATAGTALDLYPDNAANRSSLPYTRHFSYSVNTNTNPVNSAPVANSQSLNIISDTVTSLVLTGADLDGDTLTYAVNTPPRAGSLVGAAPDLIYTPNAEYTGFDSFSFSVSDGILTSNPTTVAFNIVAPPRVNNLPVANNQTLNIPFNTATAITLSGSDADQDPLQFNVVGNPARGTLGGAVPNLTYTPDSNYSGSDSFSFLVNDGVADSSTGTVHIQVQQGDVTNNMPQADAQYVTTAFETALGILLSGSDANNDPLSYQIIAQPSSGLLSGVPPQLTYTPFTGVSGNDVFTFLVHDGSVGSETSSVSITILAPEPVNLPPAATGQTLSTAFDTPVAVTLGGADPEGEPLAYQVTAQPVVGRLSGTAPDLVYTPANGFSGTETFSFQVNDGEQSSQAAVITVNVGAMPGAAISNPVSSILVDGDISDWNGLDSFGIDPDDITGPSNPLDWREAWWAHDSTNFYLAFRNDGAFTFSWGHGVYIDVDNDKTTGFTGFSGEFPIGADFLIEANDVHAYQGNGNNWSWILAGSATTSVSADIGELSLPRSVLGDPNNLQFYFRALNTPFGGTAIDHYPDAALNSNASQDARVLRYTVNP